MTRPQDTHTTLTTRLVIDPITADEIAACRAVLDRHKADDLAEMLGLVA